jgi:hypothetical protein
MFQAGPTSARRRMSPATAGPKKLHPGSSNGHTPSRVTSKTSQTSRQRKIAVKDPLEELIPWLRTASPFGAALGTPALPDLSALPGLSVMPWDLPWPHQSPLEMSVSSKPLTFSSPEPSGASGGLLSRYAQPPEEPWSRAARSLGDHSTHPISSRLPLAFPPAPPMAYPDLPKYWGGPPAPWSASTPPPANGLDFLPEPHAQNYPTRFTNTAQIFSEPRAASSSNAPVSSTYAAPSWPVYEFDLRQDALRAGAEKIGRWGRRAPIPYPAPIPPPLSMSSPPNTGELDQGRRRRASSRSMDSIFRRWARRRVGSKSCRPPPLGRSRRNCRARHRGVKSVPALSAIPPAAICIASRRAEGGSQCRRRVLLTGSESPRAHRTITTTAHPMAQYGTIHHR